MKYEWDEEKNRQNIRKHGIDFNLAKRLFEQHVVTSLDTRSDYGEEREISIGMIDGVLFLTVVHTDRGLDVRRIISARKATKQERKHYEKALHSRFKY
ncbi:MAG: BrnT family toxin [Thiolinea sp.]